MKKFKVRVELKVDSIDLVNVEVEASSLEEAKKLAITKWKENPQDYEPWESDGRDSRVDLNQIPNWEVEEVK